MIMGQGSNRQELLQRNNRRGKQTEKAEISWSLNHVINLENDKEL